MRLDTYQKRKIFSKYYNSLQTNTPQVNSNDLDKAIKFLNQYLWEKKLKKFLL